MKQKRRNNRLISRDYTELRGVDFSSKRKDCFHNLKNMYVDYSSEGNCVESIPGFRRLYAFKDKVFSLLYENGWIYVHSGEGLYRFKKRERKNPCALKPLAKMPRRKSPVISLGNSVYTLGADCLIRICDDGNVTEYPVPEEIACCTLGAACDGRMFLSGTKDNPTRVYYFDFDGDGMPIFEQIKHFESRGRISSLLPSKSGLLIFDGYGALCASTDGEGYKLNQIIVASSCHASSRLLDRVFFICGEGVYSTEDPGCLSNEILPRLTGADIKSASLGSWCGYLVLCLPGEIFLGDPMLRSRGGGSGFDWYYLCNIGSYAGDKRVYRYSPVADEGFFVHPNTDGKAEGVVISHTDSSGKTFYYTEQDGKRYSLYPTAELSGGEFSPAVVFTCAQDMLLFATESGDVCIFNNDMRGVAPPYIRAHRDFDESEYKRQSGNSIHPFYYSFAGHRAEYLLKAPDDCLNMPLTKKHTIPKTLAVRCKEFGKSAMTVSVHCDGKRVSEGHIRFENPDFSLLDFSYSLTDSEGRNYTVYEPARGWLSKQISIYGNEFCSPIGIYYIGYRCKCEDK